MITAVEFSSATPNTMADLAYVDVLLDAICLAAL
jgi:hypothetical protein